MKELNDFSQYPTPANRYSGNVNLFGASIGLCSDLFGISNRQTGYPDSQFAMFKTDSPFVTRFNEYQHIKKQYQQAQYSTSGTCGSYPMPWGDTTRIIDTDDITDVNLILNLNQPKKNQQIQPFEKTKWSFQDRLQRYLPERTLVLKVKELNKISYDKDLDKERGERHMKMLLGLIILQIIIIIALLLDFFSFL